MIPPTLTPAPSGAGSPGFRVPVYGVRLIRERTQASELERVRAAGDVYRLLRDYFADVAEERFGVLLLDTLNQIRGLHTVSVGTLDASLVHPRETFRAAILANAASLILFHNHPSGDPTPSAEDRSVTRQLRSAGEIVGIELLDHVIVGDGRYVSFAEAGLLS